MSDDLIYLSATEALAGFAAKTLSPVELLLAQIARAAATRDTVNAFTFTHFDSALEQARASEARWARGEPRGRLDGLAVAIKDESNVEGMPSSSGSLILKDHVADHTSPVNARILAEGAILHARSATPEFCCAGYTWSRLWGVTRNPWNLALTPGGSSGGSAAALALGSTALATGSDIGGSIRIPASCCGVVGFKPPYGRNPDDIPFNLDFYNHVGPMGRSSADAILLQNIMCGPSPQDIAAIHPKLTLPTAYPDLKGMRIAVSPNLDVFRVRADVAANTRAAVDDLRALGAEAEEVEIGWGPEVPEAALGYLTHLFGGAISEALDTNADLMTTYARAFAQSSQHSTARDFVRTLTVAGEAYLKLGALFERFDALVCPTTGLPAVPAEFDQSRDRIEIEGEEVSPMLGWLLTTPFNMLSRCPALSVPSGLGAEGSPTGLQIVAPPYRDETAFRVATAFEASRPGGGWFRDAASRPPT
ncbi:MAG: amidase [Pseudomonadota bacterium]